MNFALLVVSHEQDVSGVIDSFDEYVAPRPRVRMLVENTSPGWMSATELSVAWDLLSRTRAIDFIFQIDETHRFVRPIDLRPLANLLVAEPGIAQVALRIDEARLVTTTHEEGAVSWLEHEAGFVSEPSLYRRDLCAAGKPPRDDAGIFSWWGRSEQSAHVSCA